jgi:hypothetical protein
MQVGEVQSSCLKHEKRESYTHMSLRHAANMPRSCVTNTVTDVLCYIT